MEGGAIVEVPKEVTWLHATTRAAVSSGFTHPA